MGMKKTEIGMIPEDWNVQRFSDTFRILNNNTYSRAELNYVSGQFRNIHYGDVLILFPEVLDCTRDDVPYINDGVQLSGSAQSLQDGDVVMADTAEDETVGKVTEVINTSDKPVMAGLHTIPCRVKFGEFVPKWLGYYMNSLLYHDQLLPYIHGTKVSSVSKGSLGDTLIIVPKAFEQKRIVEVLSDVDALIVDLEKLIRKKKNIRQGTMLMLVTGKKRLLEFGKDSEEKKPTEAGVIPETWRCKKIGKFTDVFSGGTPDTKNSDYWGGDISWMNSGELHLKYVKAVEGRITEKGLNNSSAHMIPKNCVLIGLAGQGKTRGTAAINFMSLCTNQSIAAIYPSDEHDSLFLFYVMDSKYSLLREISSGEGGRGGLTKALIKNVSVQLPPLPEQRAIAKILLDIDTEIEKLDKKLQKYKKIKQGMMEELLTGKVRLV